AQALKCKHCSDIQKMPPYCEKTEERECSIGSNKCITIDFAKPAGQVRRCATHRECEDKVPSQVQIHCCDEDLCN
uniref:Si:rp71-1c10.11 n=1 Tax=Astyanax mexicanus TaxID=7994 RepID=A0A3B1JTX3_ASTMX